MPSICLGCCVLGSAHVNRGQVLGREVCRQRQELLSTFNSCTIQMSFQTYVHARPAPAHFPCMLRSPQLQKHPALSNAREEGCKSSSISFPKWPCVTHTARSSPVWVQDMPHFSFVLLILSFPWVSSAQKAAAIHIAGRKPIWSYASGSQLSSCLVCWLVSLLKKIIKSDLKFLLVCKGRQL